jgi:hypothetical protein
MTTPNARRQVARLCSLRWKTTDDPNRCDCYQPELFTTAAAAVLATSTQREIRVSLLVNERLQDTIKWRMRLILHTRF